MTNSWPMVALVAILVLVLFWREGARGWQGLQERRLKRYRLQAEAASRQIALTDALDAVAGIGQDGNKLLAGTIKACEVIAQATLELKEAVTRFTDTVSPSRDNGYPSDNVLQPASEEAAERAALSFEAMLRGVPAHQAEEEARESAEKKMMISATALGMEE